MDGPIKTQRLVELLYCSETLEQYCSKLGTVALGAKNLAIHHNDETSIHKLFMRICE